jgi:hypothetical protein
MSTDVLDRKETVPEGRSRKETGFACFLPSIIIMSRAGNFTDLTRDVADE